VIPAAFTASFSTVIKIPKTTHDVSACFLLQVKPFTWRSKKDLLMKRRVLHSVFLWRWKNLLWMLLVSLDQTHSWGNDRTARTARRTTPFEVSSCKRRESWWIWSMSVTTPGSDWHVPVTDTANVYSPPFVVLRTKMSYIFYMVSEMYCRTLSCRNIIQACNPSTPDVNYSGRTAPLTSKVAFYIFIQQI